MDKSQNEKNLGLIRAAQAKQAKPEAVAPAPQSVTPKQQLLEIALRMVSMARTLPTPGVTDTYLHAKTLSADAAALSKIAEGM